MATTVVSCLYCHRSQVNKHGKQQGKQRYQCQAPSCRRTFILNYKNRGFLPAVKDQLIDMCINGSGIRDTARVLKISTHTVIDTIKKSVNYRQASVTN